MKRLLEKFDVNETFTFAGLVLRCFLILMDLNKDAWCQDESIETCAEVKVEALSDKEEIINAALTMRILSSKILTLNQSITKMITIVNRQIINFQVDLKINSSP